MVAARLILARLWPTQSRAPALFEPQKIFWEAAEWHPDYPKFYTAVNALRKNHAALQQGTTEWLSNSDEHRVVTYLRRSGTEEFLVAVNLSSTPFRGTIEAGGTGWKQVDLPLATHGSVTLPFVGLDGFGFRIWARETK